MKAPLPLAFFLTAGIALSARPSTAAAEQTSAGRLVEQVMQNELHADSTDHSHWIYRDQKKTAGKSTVTMVVETATGNVTKTIEVDGHPLTPEERKTDDAQIEALVSNPDRQQEQRRNRQHDDQTTRAMMEVLPRAFIWTEAGQKGDTETLDFKPNPQFHAPSRELRVLGAMSGQMVVDLRQKRLMSLSGRLTVPVEFGWGLLGKLKKGGTFHIERQQVAPGEWQLTLIQVHIQGKALIFKSINEQQDEQTSGYRRAPASLSLAEAGKMLITGALQN